jgi:cell division protein ZapB
VETQELNRSLRDVHSEKDDLVEKVAILSKLKIEDFQVIAISSKGKERIGEFRRRHIDQLKIEFSVAENRVAPIEGKELWIRVIAPDKNVLFDVTKGSGTFMFEGREMFFTEKKEILFDRSKQSVTVYYIKGSEYALGQHTVEIYTDDYVMGKGTFVVKS